MLYLSKHIIPNLHSLQLINNMLFYVSTTTTLTLQQYLSLRFDENYQEKIFKDYKVETNELNVFDSN